jgi:hypothetical protein
MRMRNLIVQSVLLLIFVPVSVFAEPIACKQVGPDKVELEQNKIMTLAEM